MNELPYKLYPHQIKTLNEFQKLSEELDKTTARIICAPSGQDPEYDLELTRRYAHLDVVTARHHMNHMRAAPWVKPIREASMRVLNPNKSIYADMPHPILHKTIIHKVVAALFE